MNRGNPVFRDGRYYLSQTAFARAMDVTPSAVGMALYRGTLNSVGVKRGGKLKPVNVDGVDYASKKQAMAELGIHWAALERRIKAK